MQIENSVVIVTGASSGIGEAAARLLSQKGAKVVLVARSKDTLEKLSKELADSFVVVTDMTKEDQIKAMIKKVIDHFGRVNILINNAGRGYDSQVENIHIENYKEIFALDVLGPLIAMQQVIPFMKKQGKGMIINISSGTALMTIPNISAYALMKRALVTLSLTAREELKKDHISVGVVYPFITNTNFHKNILGGARKELPGQDNPHLPKADTAEFVAEKILEAIETGKAEIFAHDWMDSTKK